MLSRTARSRARRRRLLSRQCPECRGLWALTVTEQSRGRVIRCRHCSAVLTPLPAELSASPA